MVKVFAVIGSNVHHCPHCGGPLSYRGSYPFCRCSLNYEKKPHYQTVVNERRIHENTSNCRLAHQRLGHQ